MTRTPRSGIGSNQYQIRGGANVSRSNVNGAVVEAAQDDDPEDIAWAFHPDNQVWSEAGIASGRAYREWTDAGGTLEEAQMWKRVFTDRLVPDHETRNVLHSSPTMSVTHTLLFDNEYGTSVIVSHRPDDLEQALCGYVAESWADDLSGEVMPDHPRVAAVRYFDLTSDIAQVDTVAVPDTLLDNPKVFVATIQDDGSTSVWVGASEEDLEHHFTDYADEMWGRYLPEYPKPEDDEQLNDEFWGGNVEGVYKGMHCNVDNLGARPHGTNV